MRNLVNTATVEFEVLNTGHVGVSGSTGAVLKRSLSFTLAHSVTLTAAALNLIVLPGRIVESAIALSIAYVAVENLFVVERGTSKRWLVALVFGLVHGFGFSAVLKELGLQRDGLAWSLLLFNLGVEAGQALVIVAAIPLLVSLKRASWRSRAVRVMSLGVLAVGILLFVERAFFPLIRSARRDPSVVGVSRLKADAGDVPLMPSLTAEGATTNGGHAIHSGRRGSSDRSMTRRCPWSPTTGRRWTTLSRPSESRSQGQQPSGSGRSPLTSGPTPPLGGVQSRK